MGPKHSKRLSLARGGVAVVALLQLTACAYRTGGMPTVNLQTVSTAPKSGPMVYIETHCMTKGLNDGVASASVRDEQRLRGIVAGVLDRSAVFSGYTFTESRATNADMRIVLALNTDVDASIWGLALNMITLGVVPYTETSTYRLNAQVLDGQGREQGRCESKDSLRNWYQILLLPALATDQSVTKVEKPLLENLVRTVLQCLDDRGILGRSDEPPVSK